MARRAALPVETEQIAGRILVLRGEKVLLDADLAELYGVSTGPLCQYGMRHRFLEM